MVVFIWVETVVLSLFISFCRLKMPLFECFLLSLEWYSIAYLCFSLSTSFFFVQTHIRHIDIWKPFTNGFGARPWSRSLITRTKSDFQMEVITLPPIEGWMDHSRSCFLCLEPNKNTSGPLPPLMLSSGVRQASRGQEGSLSPTSFTFGRRCFHKWKKIPDTRRDREQ